MTTYHTNRLVDLPAGIEVAMRGNAVDGYDYEGIGASAGISAAALKSAIDAAPLMSVREGQDAAEMAFIRARFPAVLAKARAIMADPAGAPAFTAAESKVIQAVVVLDVAQRLR